MHNPSVRTLSGGTLVGMLRLFDAWLLSGLVCIVDNEVAVSPVCHAACPVTAGVISRSHRALRHYLPSAALGTTHENVMSG